jgi:hypothetical protein
MQIFIWQQEQFGNSIQERQSGRHSAVRSVIVDAHLCIAIRPYYIGRITISNCLLVCTGLLAIDLRHLGARASDKWNFAKGKVT